MSAARACTWIAALTVLVVLVPACGRRRLVGPAPPHVYAAASTGPNSEAGGWAWPDVSPPGTGLACRMPVFPRIVERIGREDDGAFFRSVNARADTPFGSFAVIVTDWEGGLVGDPLEAASDVADELFSEQQLGHRRTQRLDMAGFYAREDTGIAPNGVFVALRQFVGRARIYVAVSIVTQAPVPISAAEHFMGSIRLDASDALLPIGGTEPTPLFLPETDFAVRMPPLTSRRTEDLRVGDDTLVTHNFVSDASTARFRVRVIDLPEHPEPELVLALTSQLELGARGAPVSASGFPGAVYTRLNGGVSVEARIFFTASRVYVIEAAAPGSAGSSAIIGAFFDSFRIL